MSVPFRIQLLSIFTNIGFRFFTPDMGAIGRSQIMRNLFDFVPDNQTFVDDVATKNITIDESTELSARIFLPLNAVISSEKCKTILFFHGGGFCFGSPQQRIYDAFCRKLSKLTTALVVSVDYRLAPKHKYPTAYEDAFQAFKWLIDESKIEPWINLYADTSRCFLVGDSAGGNIVHNLSLKITLCDESSKYYSKNVAGQILLCPFFAGLEKLPSEILFSKGGYLANERNCDLMWKYFLPSGGDKRHVACDPILHSRSEYDRLPKTLVVVAGLDYLRDRGVAYAKCLAKANVEIELKHYENSMHDFMVFDIQMDLVMNDLLKFIRT